MCEYVGQVIRRDEAKKREKEYDRMGLFYLHDVHGSETQGGQEAFTIDPTKVGNVGRMFNHSCDPNLTTIEFPMAVPAGEGGAGGGGARLQFPRVPRVCFFAARDVEAWEELTLDYSPGRAGDSLKKAVPCRCGTPACKGWLF